MTKVWIEPVPLSDGLVRLDVRIADAPADLFGVSFHVAGRGAPWKLESYQLGTVFDQAIPMMLVDKKGDAIVTGISLRRDQKAHIQDGNLISFFVQPLEEGETTFGFDYPVLSVFHNGRKDVQDVEWLGAGVFGVAEQGQEDAAGATQTSVLSVENARIEDLYGVSEVSEQRIGDVYVVLVLSLLALLAALAFYYLYWKRRRT